MINVKHIIRSVFKNKATSLITIAGFSISISMALVLIAFLIKEFSTDSEYPRISNIYCVFANGNNASVREDFRESFIASYPDIDDACRYNNYTANVTYEDVPFSGQMIVTDNSFFNIFSSQFILGEFNTALANLNDVVLTESFAKKIFGSENPLGKTLVAEYREPLVVTAVIKDFSSKSSIRGDFLTNSKLKIIYEGSSDGQGNNVNYFRLFLLLKNRENNSGLEELLTKNFSSIEYKVGYKINRINLVPFKESYFMQGIERSQTLHANIKLISVLSVISLIIILLAVFNYINLTTATHSDRLKEIGIKKTIGASRIQIFTQFMIEAFLVCTVSFLLAIQLSALWVPFFEEFLDSKIEMSTLFQSFRSGWIVLGVFVISFISGIYPALSISRRKPIDILVKNDAGKNSSFGLRAVLNIIQYTVSVSLIITLIILSKQIEFVRSKDFGFDTNKLLRVDVHWQLFNKAKAIRDRLLMDPSISDVCFSHGTPGSIYLTSSWNATGSTDSKDIFINELNVDTSFLKVFRIPIIMGRELRPSDFNKVCYFNETAFKLTGWATFEGKKYHGKEIIGILKDFHFADMYNQIGPLAIPISSDMGISNMTIRVNPANLQRVINTLKATWKEVCPGHELKYQFYNEWINSMYKGEERLVSSIRLSAILAILISCLGILGLAEYTIKRRTKEIGLRKVNGATILNIIILLNTNFFKWVLTGFIIACPVTYFIMHKWLENFAYKTVLSWWIFALAGIIALGIALLTVSWQSWRAATRNPVEALRYE
jgi:putative ABC transport system permease protein